jgi:hypothetical protein
MKRNPKIRLSERIVVSVIRKRRIYGCTPTDTVSFTPVIYKVPYWDKDMQRIAYLYQNRIVARLVPCGMVILRLRGKAPLHKAFSLKEFCDNFYMVMDEKTGTPYFRFYRK